MKAQKLGALLLSNEDLNGLELETITRFFDMTCWLQAEIAAHQPSYVSSPPFLLPRNVHNFLLDALGIDDCIAKTLWATLREEVWVEATEDSPDIEARARRMLDMFLKHGPTYDIGMCSCHYFIEHLLTIVTCQAFYNFRPPSRTCLDPKCAVELDMTPGQTRPKELDHPLSHCATLFTKDLGPLPVRSISLYCKIGALSDNGISDTCRTKRTSRRTVCTILPLSIIPRTPVPS